MPAYTRGRAAGGVWEAITVATDGTTVLDAAAPITVDDVADILAAQPLWLPALGAGPTPLVTGADERPSWRWGTGPAERALRLMLRSRRSRVDPASGAGGGPPGSPPTADGSADFRAVAAPAASEDWEAALVEIDSALSRVVAVRDALTDRVGKARFRPSDDKRAVTLGVNQLFRELDIPEALGAAVAPVAALLPDELHTALAVEIVSRCTSARMPPQRSAPFRFLRLGPDVPLPVLDGTDAKRQAAELGDRILFGTQVNHFGAFGAVDWRRWDWLLGRLHGAAHLARMLGAGEAWIRETQLAILQAEGSSLTDLTDGVGKLAGAFPSGPDAGRRALITMRDQLNDTREGQATVRGLADRLIAVSPGLSPAIGRWAHAVLKREWDGGGVLYGWARWFTEPARLTLWQRLVRTAPQSSDATAPAPRRLARRRPRPRRRGPNRRGTGVVRRIRRPGRRAGRRGAHGRQRASRRTPVDRWAPPSTPRPDSRPAPRAATPAPVSQSPKPPPTS